MKMPKTISIWYRNGRDSKIVHNCDTLTSSQVKEGLEYHSWSIFLFTYSDLKTIVGPTSLFGLMNAVALSIYSASRGSSLDVPSTLGVIEKAPLVIVWVWMNLLPFAIDNQRQPEAILEDKANKPWRSLPSRRLRPETAKILMLVSYTLALLASLFLGTWPQCIGLIILGSWYNDFRGGDASWVTRNMINAMGYTCFSSGAMQVAIGAGSDVSSLKSFKWWYMILGLIIFSTVHTQDMYDQRGDALRKRRTLPLVVGDRTARWITVTMVGLWSVIAPILWKAPLFGYIACIALGAIVARRSLKYRTEKDDRRTFKFWNGWIVAVYLLPLIKVITSKKESAIGRIGVFGGL